MVVSISRFSPQGPEICVKERAEILKDPRLMDEFKETAFFRHNRADRHMILQKLWQYNQDIHRIKQDKMYLADTHRTLNPNTKE